MPAHEVQRESRIGERPAVRRRRAGWFSLVELLVVVAIIAVLMGILLPALKSAKDRAMEIVCAGNYKSLYVAVMGYTQDWDEWMPYCWDGTEDQYWQSHWPPRLYPYISNANDYRGVFCCPSNPNAEWRTYVGYGRPYSSNYTYYYLGNTRWGAEYYLPKKISKCPAPSGVAIMMDGKVPAFADIWHVVTGGGGSLVSYADLRHRGAINSLFVDGHSDRDDILRRDDTYAHLTYCAHCNCGTHVSRGLLWP